MPHRQPGRTTREAAVGHQRAFFTEASALQKRRRMQHLLHTGTTRRAFVAHHQHLTRLYRAVQNHRHGFLLAFHYPGGAAEMPQGFVHAGGLDDRAVNREIAAQHRESTVRGVGVLYVVDATVLRVRVQRVPPVISGKRLSSAHATRCGVEKLNGLVAGFAAANIPFINPASQAI